MTATIVVNKPKSGTLSNTASVTTTVSDANAANDQDTETTRVNKQAKQPKAKKGKPSCASPTITGTAGNDTLIGYEEGRCDRQPGGQRSGILLATARIWSASEPALTSSAAAPRTTP